MAVSVTLSSAILGVVLLLVVYFRHRKGNVSSGSRLCPPVVSIPSDDMFNNPRQAYESALAEFGPVIGVWRKGRLEYIVDNNLALDVLTNDEAFSFQEGTATILNIHYFYRRFSRFWSDMDDLVKKGISFQLETVLEKVTPIFLQRTDDRIQAMLSDSGNGINIFDHAHSTICEAMLLVVLGRRFTDRKFLKAAEEVATDIATVTGMYQNTSWWARTFPAFWRITTWSRVLLSLTFQFLPVVGPVVWGAIRDESSAGILDDEEYEASLRAGEVTVLQYLAHRWGPCAGVMSKIKCSVWIVCLILGILFASVHQTSSVVAWVICELAARPEYIQGLQEELTSLAPTDPETGFPQITSMALKGATSLDSFIREVLRTKGDTLSTCRLTTRDVNIGGVVIPKGYLVIPMASLSHFNPEYHGSDADVFDGDRWTRQSDSKPAIMGSVSYFPFGLGKWACPGRFLAINEIKLVVWSIIRRWSPQLKGGRYRIPDPLNITSVPPEATVLFSVA